MTERTDLFHVEQIQQTAAAVEQTRRLLAQAKDLPSIRRRLEVSPMADEDLPEYPRWPSGIAVFDEKYGGFQGLTVLGGEWGAGKSGAALASSLEAAHQDICTIVVDAENGAGLVQKRVRRWYGHNFAQEFPRIAGTSWFWTRAHFGHRLSDVVDLILQRYMTGHTGILVVLDSLNTISDLMSKPQANEFQNLRFLVAWMDWLVQESHGFIRFIACSELNAAGGIKGRNPAYRASVGLTIRKKPNGAADECELDLIKHRDGAAGKLGTFTRDWQTSRFFPAKEEA